MSETAEFKSGKRKGVKLYNLPPVTLWDLEEDEGKVSPLETEKETFDHHLLSIYDSTVGSCSMYLHSQDCHR